MTPQLRALLIAHERRSLADCKKTKGQQRKRKARFIWACIMWEFQTNLTELEHASN